jgi:hypothetical protein
MTARWTDTSVCLGHPEWPDAARPEALLEAMDACDIGEAWIFGYDAVATHAFEPSNEKVRRQAAEHPDRFVPIGLVNPFHAFPAVDRLLDQGFKSIKILTGWGN